MSAALGWRDLLGPQFDAPGQGLLTRMLSQPLGRFLAAAGYAFGWHPNHLTYLGLVVSVIGSLLFAGVSSQPVAIVMGALVLWHLGFAFDCADGQLARATRGGSDYGAWLDVSCDFIRQASVCCALMWVLLQGEHPLLGLFTVFVLLAGLSVYLFSASVAKNVESAQAAVTGWRKHCVASGLDTPVFLTALVILRSHERLLIGYCILYGVALILRAWRIGMLRIRAVS